MIFSCIVSCNTYHNACKYSIFLSFFLSFNSSVFPFFASYPPPPCSLSLSLSLSLSFSLSLQLLSCPTLVLHSFGFSARYGVNILERSRDKAVIGCAIVNRTNELLCRHRIEPCLIYS